MKIVSVNVGLPRQTTWHGVRVTTGILKEPVLGPVPIHKLKLSGDAQPRMPCYKLNLRFKRDDMIRRFLESRRRGFYFSVIREGEVSAGSDLEFVRRDPAGVTVINILDLYLGRARDSALVERAMNLTALPANWKTDLQSRPAADRF